MYTKKKKMTPQKLKREDLEEEDKRGKGEKEVPSPPPAVLTKIVQEAMGKRGWEVLKLREREEDRFLK